MAASGYRAAGKRRPTAFLLALAAHLLVIAALIGLAPRVIEPPQTDRRLATFSLYPSDRDVEHPSERRQVRPREVRRKADAAKATPQQAPHPAPTPTPAAPWLFGDRSLFAAGDIAKLGHAQDGEGTEVADTGGDSSSTYGPGDGPGGARLYNAEWYREPPGSALAAYMPERGAPAGAWAMVACRTVADFRVDNCRSLGESPLGSGLARALREAAWQFRVRPPRIGGKSLVGAWVRIRFDFTADGEAVARRG